VARQSAAISRKMTFFIIPPSFDKEA